MWSGIVTGRRSGTVAKRWRLDRATAWIGDGFGKDRDVVHMATAGRRVSAPRVDLPATAPADVATDIVTRSEIKHGMMRRTLPPCSTPQWQRGRTRALITERCDSNCSDAAAAFHADAIASERARSSSTIDLMTDGGSSRNYVGYAVPLRMKPSTRPQR
jgi:hypothetical protein